MGIEEAPLEFVSHLGKKLLLPGLLNGMLYELHVGLTEKWLLNLPKGEMVLLRGPNSWKSLADILQDTEKGNWQTANIGKTVFKISCSWKSLLNTMGL